MKIAILIGGRGSNCEALLKAKAGGGLPKAEFALVLSHRPDASGLLTLGRYNVPTDSVDHRDFGGDRVAFEAAVVAKLRAAGVKALVLAGWMRVLGPTVLDAFPQRVINIHPSLLPAFPGVHAPRQALDHGVRVSGCTVHFVEEAVDTGPIIVQRAVPVRRKDNEDTLAARILVQEHAAIVEAVDLLSREMLTIQDGRVLISEEDLATQ